MIEPELHLFWQDNNGRKAEQRFFLPADEPVAASVARANAIRNAARALSNAQLVRGELVYPDLIEPAGVAAVDSNVWVNLVMLFSDGTVTGSLRLPSPAPSLPYDTTGPWAGQRITRDALAALGLVAPLEAAVAETTFPWGDPWPATFIAAGIDFTI